MCNRAEVLLVNEKVNIVKALTMEHNESFFNKLIQIDESSIKLAQKYIIKPWGKQFIESLMNNPNALKNYTPVLQSSNVPLNNRKFGPNLSTRPARGSNRSLISNNNGDGRKRILESIKQRNDTIHEKLVVLVDTIDELKNRPPKQQYISTNRIVLNSTDSTESLTSELDELERNITNQEQQLLSLYKTRTTISNKIKMINNIEHVNPTVGMMLITGESKNYGAATMYEHNVNTDENNIIFSFFKAIYDVRENVVIRESAVRRANRYSIRTNNSQS